MYNIRTIPMLHLLKIPQYAIEEPVHLKKTMTTMKKFLYSLKIITLQVVRRTILNTLKNV